MIQPDCSDLWIPHGAIIAPGVRISVFTWVSAPTDYTRQGENALYMMLPPYAGSTTGSYRLEKQFGDFVSVGNVLFIPAEIPVRFRGPGGPVRSICCEFDSARFESVTRLGRHWDGNRLAAALDIRNAHVSQMLLRSAREAAAPGFACKSLIEGLGLSLMADLSRYVLAAQDRRQPPTGRLAPWQLARITEFVEDQTQHFATISELAELCGISPSHLKRVFRQTTGQTIHGYIEQVRTDRARALLCKTSLPLKEIAARLGFASLSGFSIAFRRASGQTPSSFRQQSSKRAISSH